MCVGGAKRGREGGVRQGEAGHGAKTQEDSQVSVSLISYLPFFCFPLKGMLL